jgi:hypothetical protein
MIFVSLLFFTTLTANSNIVNLKEGVINYDISGSEKGIKTIYFKDYGNEQLIYTKTKTKIMRKNEIKETITHVTPTWIYETDLTTNKTTKFHNIKYLLDEHSKTLTSKQREKIKRLSFDLILEKEVKIFGFYSKSVAIEVEEKTVDFISTPEKTWY